MPVNTLFWECLEKKTSIRESSRSATLSKKRGECAFLFKTDTDEFRKAFGLTDKRCCDGLFLFKNMSDRSCCSLVFVELKGKSAEDGVKQLMNGLQALQAVTKNAFDKQACRFYAVVVYGGGVITNKDKHVEEFSKLGATLKFSSRESLDIRKEILNLG